MATFVNSLNGISGITSLKSTDSSILFGFSPLDNDINLIASKAGNQGGVTSLNTLTGANFITSTGGSIVITTPVGFPTGHNINIEAVQGGVVGINTINNLPSDGTHNFTIAGAKGNTIISNTNGITVEAPNSVFSINSVTPLGSDIELIGGGTTTITSGPLSNQITISSSGGGGGSLQTVNGWGGDIAGNVEIIGGTNITIDSTVANQVTINGTGIAQINSVPPTAGGEFTILAGGTISITNQTNGITIADSGIATINTTAVPDLNHNFEILQGSGISVATGTNGVTISATGGGGGGIASINGSTPATSDFTLTQGTGILITTLSPGDISISQSAAPVTEMNGIFPSAGTIDVVGGGGISVASSGNTITISTTGAAGVPGFEYVTDDTLTFVGSGVGNVTAPYTVYISGVAPNQIATLQMNNSSSAQVTDNTILFFTTQLTIPGYTLKYPQGGMCLGQVPYINYYCIQYYYDTTGYMTLAFISPYPSNGANFNLYGMSLTFPVVPIPPPPPISFDMLFENQLEATTIFPATQPTTTQTLTLTQPAYVGAPTVYNIASTTFPGGNCPTVTLAATTQTEVSQFGGAGGSLFTQYTFGTTTVIQTVDLQTATGINDLYTLAICSPPTNDKCYALMFSASSNAHYIIDVFSSPLVDLNLSISGPALIVNSMSCDASILVLCTTPFNPPQPFYSEFRSYTLVASPSSISFLANDFANPLCPGPAAAGFSLLYNNQVFYSDTTFNNFYSVPATTLQFSPSGITYTPPPGYFISRCIGNDPYGNVLVAAQSGSNYTIFAYSTATPTVPVYEISGSWGAQIPLIAR